MFFFLLLFISPYLLLCLSILPLALLPSTNSIHYKAPSVPTSITHTQAGNNKRPLNLKLCCFLKNFFLWICGARQQQWARRQRNCHHCLGCHAREALKMLFTFSHIFASPPLSHRRGFLKRKRQVNSSSTMHFHLASLECLLFCFSHSKWKAHG